MKTSTLKILDIVLIAVALTIAGGATYCLNNTSLLFQLAGITAGKNTTLGEIKTIENDVRRRMGRSIIWQPMSQSESLFEGDALFTGQDSSAQITLDDGGELNISPNSMIFLTTENGEISLDLQIGSIQAKIAKGKTLKLKQGRKAIRLKSQNKNTAVKIRKQKDQIRVSTTKGTAKIEVKGREQVISPKKALEITKKLTVKKVSHNISLLSPKELDSVWLKPEESTNFKWKLADRNQTHSLKISKSASFNSILHEATISPEKETHSIPLEEGYYWWKVESSDKKSLSLPQQFQKITDKKLTLLLPKSDHLFKYELPPKHPEGYSTRFVWKKRYGSSGYELEVSTSADFTQIIQKLRSDTNKISRVDLKEGTYFWRARALGPSGQRGAWSIYRKFSIAMKDPIKPTTLPSPSPQPPNPTVDPIKNPITKPTVLSKTEPDLPLPVAKPVTVKPKPVMKKPIVLKKIKPKKVILDQPELLPLSNIKKRVRTPKLVKTQTIPVKVEWIPVKGAVSYKFQMSSDIDFKSITKEKITDSTSSTVELTENGSYHFRVFPLKKREKVGGPVSQNIHITLKKYFVLKPPKIYSSPSTQIKVISFGNSDKKSPIIFSWKQVKFAEQYELQFSTTKDFSKIDHSVVSEDTNFILTENLPTGLIYWRLRSLSKTHKSTWTKKGSFNLGK